ncbi:hypothetical protein C0Q92_15285 [Streptomyces albidoflavus]|uniref:Uncharacterized protein n=1 Tax=Streptomyces albidoflavus TaxID=1886 RepID=A0A8G1ZRB9_9ACTN|nr:hypothetical protein C0Q92_15285 [Streptomyces albidoflavus]RZE39740.1 hypothetical protein C0Q91_15295 [Streptomyces albidoflavus]RZE44059.1 hypothetical protein C0Q95_14370 [Streptomyces albidoflavus]
MAEAPVAAATRTYGQIVDQVVASRAAVAAAAASLVLVCGAARRAGRLRAAPRRAVPLRAGLRCAGRRCAGRRAPRFVAMRRPPSPPCVRSAVASLRRGRLGRKGARFARWRETGLDFAPPAPVTNWPQAPAGLLVAGLRPDRAGH